jgi:hypothetical protein
VIGAFFIVSGVAMIVFSGGLARFVTRRNHPRLLDRWPGGAEGARKATGWPLSWARARGCTWVSQCCSTDALEPAVELDLG